MESRNDPFRIVTRPHSLQDFDGILNWVHSGGSIDDQQWAVIMAKNEFPIQYNVFAFDDPLSYPMDETGVGAMRQAAVRHLAKKPPLDFFRAVSASLQLDASENSLVEIENASYPWLKSMLGESESVLLPLASAYLMIHAGNLGVLTMRSSSGLAQALTTAEGIARNVVFDFSKSLQQICDEALANGAEAIQMVADTQNVAQLSILQLSGFEQVATIAQMSRDLSQLDIVVDKDWQVARYESADRVRWPVAKQQSSQTLSLDKIRGDDWNIVCDHPRRLEHDVLSELIAETFVGSMDCPVMNDIRSPSASVASYLANIDACAGDSELLTLPWFLLANKEEIVGCALINQTAPGMAELAYIGIVPRYRKFGLGKMLLDEVLCYLRQKGVEQIWLGVDAKNTSALRLYQNYQFDCVRHVDVWYRW